MGGERLLIWRRGFCSKMSHGFGCKCRVPRVEGPGFLAFGARFCVYTSPKPQGVQGLKVSTMSLGGLGGSGFCIKALGMHGLRLRVEGLRAEGL